MSRLNIQRKLVVMAGVGLMHAVVLGALTSGWRLPPKEPDTLVAIRLDIASPVLGQDKRARVATPLTTSVRPSANLTRTSRQDARAQSTPIAAPTPVPTALPTPSPTFTPTTSPTAQPTAGPTAPAGTSSAASSLSESALSGPSMSSPSPAPSPAVRATAASPQVQLPASDADYLNNAKPVYPPLSKRLGEQGHVLVRTLIGADGAAQRAEIARSSGFERLDKAALETVMKWRYVPGKRAGVPEAMWFNVPLRFVLE